METQKLEEIKTKIVTFCQRLWTRGLVANHDGNISFRLSESQFLVTPTSFSKKDVTELDLLIVDSAGKVLEGKHKVFGEFAWHLGIYHARKDVTCVVHAHPPVATGFGLSDKEIGIPLLPEAIVSLGRKISKIPFFSPLEITLNSRSDRFEMAVKNALEESNAFLAPGNGAWAVGQSVEQTALRLELVEQVAQAHLVAHQLGGVKPLAQDIVEELLKKRAPKATAPTAALPTERDPALGTVTGGGAVSLSDLKIMVKSELEKVLLE